MQNEIQVPITIRAAPKRKIGFFVRAKAERAKLIKARRALNFAQNLNLAGVSAKAKTRSVMDQYGVTTREARLCVKLAKPKKHRKRS